MAQDSGDGNTFLVPQLPKAPRGGRTPIQLSWGLGNVLHVFCPPPGTDKPGHHSTAQQEFQFSFSHSAPLPSSQETNEKGSLVALIWADTSAPSRRTAALSAPLFGELQDGLQQCESDRDRWSEVVEWSSKISQGVLSGRLLQGSGISRSGQQESMHMIWDLLRISYLFSSSFAPSFIPAAPALGRWMKVHSQSICPQQSGVIHQLQNLIKEMKQNQVSPAEDLSSYWEVAAGCVALGWISEAVSILRMHSSYKTLQQREREAENGLVEAVAVVISEMPSLDESNQQDQSEGAVDVIVLHPADIHQFIQRRDRWRARLSKLDAIPYWAQCGDGRTERGLRWVIQIALGSGEALGLAVGKHWPQLLLARLLHQHPQAGLDTLGDLAERARISSRAFGRDRSTEAAREDDLIFAIIQKETEEVLSRCSRSFNSWMMAHTAEIVSFSIGSSLPSQIPRQPQVHAPVVAPWGYTTTFRLNYTLELLAHPATWELAVPYLWCTTSNALPLLETVLTWQAEQPNAHPQKDLQPIMDLTSVYGATAAEQQIARYLGQQCIERGELPYAIHWLSKSGTKHLLGQVVYQLLATWNTVAASSPDGLVQWCTSRTGQALQTTLNKMQGLQADPSFGVLKRVWETQKGLQELHQKLSTGNVNVSAVEDHLASNAPQALDALVSFPWLFLGILLLMVPALRERGQMLLSSNDINKIVVQVENLIGSSPTIESAYKSQLAQLRLALSLSYSQGIICNR